MQNCDAYTAIFPHMFKHMSMLLAIPMTTATVERSYFSQMKVVKIGYKIFFQIYPYHSSLNRYWRSWMD